MTGKNGVYNPNAAEVIGVRESEHIAIPIHLRDLAKKYDPTGTYTNWGKSYPGFGLLEMGQADIARRIIQFEEGFQTLDSYLSK